jgi:hypothetical protein
MDSEEENELNEMFAQNKIKAEKRKASRKKNKRSPTEEVD